MAAPSATIKFYVEKINDDLSALAIKCAYLYFLIRYTAFWSRKINEQSTREECDPRANESLLSEKELFNKNQVGRTWSIP